MNYTHTRSTVCADIHTQDVLLVCGGALKKSYRFARVFQQEDDTCTQTQPQTQTQSQSRQYPHTHTHAHVG